MTDIQQTQLPGMGIRYDFRTADGQWVAVVHHRSGRREVFVCPACDPDTATLVLSLAEEDVHTLVDVLGGSRVVASVVQATQHIEGLAIDWLAVDAGGPYVGRTIGEARVRTRTGVSIVAILRHGQAVPAPGPEASIEAGDTLVVVGTPEGIEAVRCLLRSG